MEVLRSSGIEAALKTAVERGDGAALYDRLERASGLPGPRPNLDLARAVGGAIAAHGRRADHVVAALLGHSSEYLVIVGILSAAARFLAGVDEAGALEAMHERAGDERRLVRDGVVHGLRAIIAVRGEAAIERLASWTDGYLHAHVVLEALGDRSLLSQLGSGTEVVARLAEAFALADGSPRAHERSQGLRTLRRHFPEQIVAIATRFPEASAWLAEQAQRPRPETRDVVAETIATVRKRLSGPDADRLAAIHSASAKPPRDPSRIVHGTRKRSKGRTRPRR